MQTETNIHQIYYKSSQRSSLDGAFKPYFNKSNERPEWREFHVFRSQYKNGMVPENALTGYFSWKFNLKAGITGKEFLEFINHNPGFDVYFVNPFPQETILFRSVWEQGEFCHPGITELVQGIFDKLGYATQIRDLKNDSLTTAYCNFWAGTRKFWDTYMEFCEPVYQHIEKHLTDSEKSVIHSRADRNINASFLSFIMERVFSTVLSIREDIKYLGYSYSDEELQTKWGSDSSLYKKAQKMRELADSQPADSRLEFCFISYRELLKRHLELDAPSILKHPEVSAIYRFVKEQPTLNRAGKTSLKLIEKLSAIKKERSKSLDEA